MVVRAYRASSKIRLLKFPVQRAYSVGEGIFVYSSRIDLVVALVITLSSPDESKPRQFRTGRYTNEEPASICNIARTIVLAAIDGCI
jgi:hypothetical protein